MAWLKLLVALAALLGQRWDTPPSPMAVTVKSGTVWIASGHGRKLAIYRLDHLRLRVDGSVRLPAGFPIRPNETLTASALVPGVAPTFAVRQWGADSLWFAIAARRRGRWQMIPFDDMYATRHPYTFALGASHHLVHGLFDACSCASGPTTEQWYRFARGVFVATTPPDTRSDCSTATLNRARHWPRLAYEPLLQAIDRPLTISRFACANGWALATNGTEVAVYEQRSTGWLRVGIGSPRQIMSRVVFAMPRSLLDRLALRLGPTLPG